MDRPLDWLDRREALEEADTYKRTLIPMSRGDINLEAIKWGDDRCNDCSNYNTEVPGSCEIMKPDGSVDCPKQRGDTDE